MISRQQLWYYLCRKCSVSSEKNKNKSTNYLTMVGASLPDIFKSEWIKGAILHFFDHRTLLKFLNISTKRNLLHSQADLMYEFWLWLLNLQWRFQWKCFSPTLVNYKAAPLDTLMENYGYFSLEQYGATSKIELFVDELNTVWPIWLFCFAWWPFLSKKYIHFSN